MQREITCSGFEDLAVLYAAGEIDDARRATVDQHANHCAGCAAILRTEMELRSALAAHGDGDDSLNGSELLLAQCRSELAEALDDGETARKRSLLERISPARWSALFPRVLALHPGWSTAVLLILGAFGGIAGRAWYRHAAIPLPGVPVMTVSAAPTMTDQQLESILGVLQAGPTAVGVDGIRLEPQAGSAPRVELHLRSDQPMVLQGTPDDAEIRRVLDYVVRHGQQFDPGVRLDSIDALRTQTADPQVRSALCAAAVGDSNPAVRLKALEALRSFGFDPAARQAMFDVLAGDDNSGMRIEAIDALQAALAGAQSAPWTPPGDLGISILRDRVRNDPNRYVRQHSASVLSQLTSLEDVRP